MVATQLFTLLWYGVARLVSDGDARRRCGQDGEALPIGIRSGLSALTRPEGYLLCALLGLHRLYVKAS